MIHIPKQLNSCSFVILGGDDGKKPISKNWTKLRIKKDDDELVQHLKEDKNYGVLCGEASPIKIDNKNYFLIGVDFDNQKVQEELLAKLPETFTVKTGGKGLLHLYFASDDSKSFKIFDNEMNTLVDVQGDGRQLVAPNSINTKTNRKYEIIKDIPINFISYSELEAILMPYDSRPKKQKVIKEFIAKGFNQNETNEIINAVSMQTVLSECNVNVSRNPTNCPFHTSNGGKCLSWNEQTIHCFHCEGSWNRYSILKEFKKLTDKQTFEWFAEAGGNLDKLKKTRKEFLKQKKLDDIKKSESIIENQTLDNNSFKIEILELVALSGFDIEKKRIATEKMCNKILSLNKIYTTRDDDNSEIWIYKDGIYIPQGKSYIREFCREYLGHVYTPQLVNEVISKIEVDTYIESDKFFNQNNLSEIPVENGILNIFTAELKPFDSNKIFFSKIPIKYDVTAQCNNIEKFLKGVLKNESDINILEELFGYCLLKDYRFEKAFMFIGSGRNGKSRTLELVKRFVGVDNCSNIPIQEFERDNFALGNLHGKLVNISADLSSEALNNTGNFKMTTGMDSISANRKFKPRINFVNYAKQLFSCNKLPISYDTSPAFFNRWIILEFPYTFLSQKEIDCIKDEKEKAMVKLADKEIVDRISTPEEMSGLLNRALVGLNRLISNRDFSYSQSVKDVKDMWIRKSDSFHAFCMDCIEQDFNSTISKQELRKMYTEYCKRFKLASVGDKSMKETLSREFGVIDDRRQVLGMQEYVWVGIRIKEVIV